MIKKTDEDWAEVVKVSSIDAKIEHYLRKSWFLQNEGHRLENCIPSNM